MHKDIIFVTCNSTPCTLMPLKIHPILVTIFSVQHEADPVFSNAIVSLTTLAGMGAVPVLFFLLK